MKIHCPRRVFRYWASRLAMAAMLALVAVPTAGRLYAAATGDASAMVAGANGAHGHAADERRADAVASDPAPSPAPDRRHQGHADCPYCPLLGQLVGIARPLPLAVAAPAGPAPSSPAARGHASRRPHGPYARGPPATA